MRSQLSLKPKTYPESMDVDVAGISGKVNAHYPGRSAPCLWVKKKTEIVVRQSDHDAEVSRWHSKPGL